LDEHTVGFLQISVKSARNLGAFDPDGFSDPFCVLSLEGCTSATKLRTKVINKTLNPVWNEDFVFHVLKDYDPSKVELLISLFDKDAIGSDDMGFLKFRLSELISEPRTSGWYAVQPPLGYRKTDKLGEVELLFKYFSKAEGEAHGIGGDPLSPKGDPLSPKVSSQSESLISEKSDH